MEELGCNNIPDIFVNDKDSPKLDEEYIHCLLYADDLAIFSLSLDGLQSKLNRLNEYCMRWDLTVNTLKTDVMVISHDKKYVPSVDITIGECH